MLRHLLKLTWNRRQANGLLALEYVFVYLALLVVTVGALLLVERARQPMGFDAAPVWQLEARYWEAGLDAFTEIERRAIMERLVTTFRAHPQVEAVGLTDLYLYSTSGSFTTNDVEGESVSFGVLRADDGLADALALHMVEGRWFGPEDDGQAYTPVVVNRSLADELWAMTSDSARAGRTGPLGLESTAVSDTPLPARVIGIVDHFRREGRFEAELNWMMRRYAVADTATSLPSKILLRMRPGTPTALQGTLMELARQTEPTWGYNIRRAEELREDYQRQRLAPLLLGGLVLLFLVVMIVLGLTGVLGLSVTRRTGELGVRRALGATAGGVRRLILGELLVVATVGLLPGLLLALGLAGRGLLAFAPPAVLLVAFPLSLILIYALTLACAWVPARYAMRVEPAAALRDE